MRSNLRGDNRCPLSGTSTWVLFESPVIQILTIQEIPPDAYLPPPPPGVANQTLILSMVRGGGGGTPGLVRGVPLVRLEPPPPRTAPRRNYPS